MLEVAERLSVTTGSRQAAVDGRSDDDELELDVRTCPRHFFEIWESPFFIVCQSSVSALFDTATAMR